LSDGLPVFLNGNEVEEAVVGVGDRLQVGATELLLEPAPDLPMAWPSESARRHTRI
jgi:hypothetical protein